MEHLYKCEIPPSYILSQVAWHQINSVATLQPEMASLSFPWRSIEAYYSTV